MLVIGVKREGKYNIVMHWFFFFPFSIFFSSSSFFFSFKFVLFCSDWRLFVGASSYVGGASKMVLDLPLWPLSVSSLWYCI